MNLNKQVYTPPKLEPQQPYTWTTGVSLSIGVTAADNPFELDFMEGGE